MACGVVLYSLSLSMSGHGWMCDPCPRQLLTSHRSSTGTGLSGSCGRPEDFVHLRPKGFASENCPNCFWVTNKDKLATDCEVITNDKPVHHFGPPCSGSEGKISGSREKFLTTPNSEFGITATYASGGVYDVQMYLTITHMGYMWFDYACLDGYLDATIDDSRIKWKRLKIVEAPGKIYRGTVNKVPLELNHTSFYTYTVKVEMRDEACDHGILQWNWWSTEIWGEHFRNCADITVTADSGTGGSEESNSDSPISDLCNPGDDVGGANTSDTQTPSGDTNGDGAYFKVILIATAAVVGVCALLAAFHYLKNRKEQFSAGAAHVPYQSPVRYTHPQSAPRGGGVAFRRREY